MLKMVSLLFDIHWQQQLEKKYTINLVSESKNMESFHEKYKCNLKLGII